MKKSNIIALAVIFSILVFFGVYKHSTRLPDGITETDTIMSMGSDSIDSKLGMEMEVFPDQVIDSADKYRMFVYRNSRTGRYVFPVKNNKINKVHYCYLVSYTGVRGYSEKMAIDIDDSNWVRTIDKQTTNIIGHNPEEKAYKYTIRYYYNHFTKLDL